MSYEKNALDRLNRTLGGQNDRVTLVRFPNWVAESIPVLRNLADGFVGQVENTMFLAARRGDVVVVFIGVPGDTLVEQLVAVRVELEKAVAAAGGGAA
jgi:hypothetical protein